MTPQHTAYLMVGLRHNGTPFPSVFRVGIFSHSDLPCSRGETYASVLALSRTSSYQEARDALVEYIMTMPHLKWARPWVDDSENGARARARWACIED